MDTVQQYLSEMADYFIDLGVITPEQKSAAMRLPTEYNAFTFEDRALLLTKGCEIHLFIREPWRKMAVSRRAAHSVLGPLLDRYGYVTTVLFLNEDPDKINFVRRMGFSPTWSDGLRQYYMLTSLPFCRSKT